MTIEQEQSLIDYIREMTPENDYYNHSPEPDRCGHVHCTYHGLCFLVELRNVLTLGDEPPISDAEFVRRGFDLFSGLDQYRGLTELGNVPAWKAEANLKRVAGVQLPHPLPALHTWDL
jgi:hypothetical protein